MIIDDTIRLDYLLKLLNSGGTDGLLRIAPEVCADWNRESIDFGLNKDRELIRSEKYKKANELLAESKRILSELNAVNQELEKLK